jgi:hypothetical protein
VCSRDLLRKKPNGIRDERHILLLAHSLPNHKGGGEQGMKRLVLSILCLVALTLTAIPASAQTRTRLTNRGVRYDRRFDQNNVVRRYDNQVYRNNNYRYDSQYDNGYWDDRSTWDRSRDKITTAIGAGAGAAVGAITRGKRGAIIGAITGGGAAALYTYVLRDKDDRY